MELPQQYFRRLSVPLSSVLFSSLDVERSRDFVTWLNKRRDRDDERTQRKG
jgi:hypothetical protein